MNLSDCRVFASGQQVERIELPEGHRFMVFIRDRAPRSMPITETGTYEIDASILPGGSWPVLVATVPSEHVEAFAKISASRSNELLAQATGHS